MVAVVINRSDRRERRLWCMEQFSKYGMSVELFSAVIDSPGWKGCRDSYFALFEKYHNEKHLMTFEDDVEFLSDPTIAIQEVFKELPLEWDILYFGISPAKPYERISDHLFKVDGGYCTHAMLWRNREGGVVDYILKHRDEVLKIDVFLSSVIHKKFNCYVVYPLLATQRQFQSDTCQRSDVSTIVKNYNKFCV